MALRAEDGGRRAASVADGYCAIGHMKKWRERGIADIGRVILLI